MPQCRWRHNGTLVSYSVAISVPCVRQFRGQLRVMLVAHLRHRHVPKAAAHIDAAVWDSSTKWQVAEARPTTDMFRERTSARRTKPEGLPAPDAKTPPLAAGARAGAVRRPERVAKVMCCMMPGNSINRNMQRGTLPPKARNSAGGGNCLHPPGSTYGLSFRWVEYQ